MAEFEWPLVSNGMHVLYRIRRKTVLVYDLLFMCGLAVDFRVSHCVGFVIQVWDFC